MWRMRLVSFSSWKVAKLGSIWAEVVGTLLPCIGWMGAVCAGRPLASRSTTKGSCAVRTCTGTRAKYRVPIFWFWTSQRSWFSYCCDSECPSGLGPFYSEMLVGFWFVTEICVQPSHSHHNQSIGATNTTALNLFVVGGGVIVGLSIAATPKANY